MTSPGEAASTAAWTLVYGALGQSRRSSSTEMVAAEAVAGTPIANASAPAPIHLSVVMEAGTLTEAIRRKHDRRSKTDRLVFDRRSKFGSAGHK